IVQHAPRLAVDVGEPERKDIVQRVVLEHGDGPVGVLLDEGDVDDAADVVVDQLGDSRHDLALEPVARKRDDDVLDWSTAGHVASSPTTRKGAPHHPGDTRAWEPPRRPEYVVTIIRSGSYPSNDQARQAFDELGRVEHRMQRPE